MGISVFAKTRKRQLVEMLHGHGISIPYDRVLEVSVQLVDAAVAKYVEDALRSIGILLRDSGGTGAIFEAGVVSSATAESFMSADSITRTGQAHQVTSSSLYKLLKSAYADYCSQVGEDIEGVFSLKTGVTDTN